MDLLLHASHMSGSLKVWQKTEASSRQARLTVILNRVTSQGMHASMHPFASLRVISQQIYGSSDTMRVSNRKLGKRNFYGRKNELEEYFSDLAAEGLEDNSAPRPNKVVAGLSHTEEIRRLTAYVAHLAERVTELQNPLRSSSLRPANPVGAIVGLTAMAGLAAALFMIVRSKSNSYR